MHLRKYAALVCVFDLASLVLIAVGVVTSQWVISDVSDDGAANRGEVSLGLFRTSYSIRFKEADYREEETSRKPRPSRDDELDGQTNKQTVFN